MIKEKKETLKETKEALKEKKEILKKKIDESQAIEKEIGRASCRERVWLYV